MRQVSIAELEEHVSELKAGQRLKLIYGGQPIADVVPISESLPALDSIEHPKQWTSEDERLAAVEEFSRFLRQGVDMGGFTIADRDELYDRD